MIGPHIWPAGVAPDSVLELVLWDAHANLGACKQEARQQEQVDNGRQGAQDMQQQEQELRSWEQLVQLREQGIQQREQELHDREHLVQLREQEVEQREGYDQVREPGACACADLGRIREHHRCLSFFACKARLGDYYARNYYDGIDAT